VRRRQRSIKSWRRKEVSNAGWRDLEGCSWLKCIRVSVIGYSRRSKLTSRSDIIKVKMTEGRNIVMGKRTQEERYTMDSVCVSTCIDLDGLELICRFDIIYHPMHVLVAYP
jgi:hypothetical protein